VSSELPALIYEVPFVIPSPISYSIFID